jgi:hypothetical protein
MSGKILINYGSSLIIDADIQPIPHFFSILWMLVFCFQAAKEDFDGVIE